MVHKLPESEGEAREQGLFMAINPWLPQFICYILKWIGSMGPSVAINFLSVYGIYNLPVTIETRLKWRIYINY